MNIYQEASELRKRSHIDEMLHNSRSYDTTWYASYSDPFQHLWIRRRRTAQKILTAMHEQNPNVLYEGEGTVNDLTLKRGVCIRAIDLRRKAVYDQLPRRSEREAAAIVEKQYNLKHGALPEYVKINEQPEGRERMCTDTEFKEAIRQYSSIARSLPPQDKKGAPPLDLRKPELSGHLYQLSIIVPIHNGDKYLPRFLAIFPDLPEDVELLLVNNHSTDDTAAIVADYAKKHEHCRVIYEAKKGLPFARNAGLDNMRGKYAWIIDVDDSIKMDSVKIILEQIEQFHFDLLIFDYQHVDDPWPHAYPDLAFPKRQEAGLTTQRKILHEMLTGKADPIGGFTHNKVYSKRLIGKARFQDYKMAEDLPFFIDRLLASKKILRLRQTLYNYYQNPKSMVNTPNAEKLMDYLKVVQRIEDTLKSSSVADDRDIDEYVTRRRLSIYFQNVFGPKNKTLIKKTEKAIGNPSIKQMLPEKKDQKLLLKIVLYKSHLLELVPKSGLFQKTNR